MKLTQSRDRGLRLYLKACPTLSINKWLTRDVLGEGVKKIRRAPAQEESCDKRIANRGRFIMFYLP